jgi:hypothetical protein
MLPKNTVEVHDLRVALSTADCGEEQNPTEVHRVLADVYQLLEEYAPTWYSTEIREKLQTALESLSQ